METLSFTARYRIADSPPEGSSYHRVLRRILILIVLLVVYGSLYPWHFARPHLTASPLWLLLHPRPIPFRYFLKDALINIALYIPLGFAAHSVFRKSRSPGFGIYGPVLLGLLLSVAMELTQLLEPVRDTSIFDVITNVVGSGCGVILGLLFEALNNAGQILDRPVADRGALMLAFCWAAWLFFPFFPDPGFFQPSRRLAVFLHSRVLDPVLLVSTAGAWFAAGLLISSAAGARVSRGWFALTLLAIPAQLFIVERQPLPSFLLGAVAGVLLFVLYHRAGGPAKTAALAFLVLIALRGLWPFHFVTASTAFGWIPFGATLAGDWQQACGVLIEKTFYYGTAIWLLHAAGMNLRWSVLLVAGVLGSIEILQMHMPGRTPEVTDPILAILVGFVLAAFSGPARRGVKRREVLQVSG